MSALRKEQEIWNRIGSSDIIDIEDVRELYDKMQQEKHLAKYTFPQKPSSDGYYHVFVDDPSKKSGRRQIKARTLEELRDKILQHEKCTSPSLRRNFRDVFELILSERPKYVKDSEKLLSLNNTICKNRYEYSRYFEGTDFEKMYVDEISKRDIENICFYNLNRLELRDKSFLGMRGILKSVFQKAYEEYWINDNPYSRVDFKRFKDMLVQSASIEERVHSDDEVERMIAYIHDYQRKMPSFMSPYALELQIAMGLRRGEVPPLEWNDIRDGYISISKEQLTVKKSDTVKKQYCKIVSHTKTWKDRRFPITSDVQACLDKIREAHDRYYQESPYLFPNKSGDGVIHNSSLYNFYWNMCKRLGIEICHESRKGTHSFRRNAITKVVNETGGDIVMASQLFGNTPKVAMSNYYAGLDMDKAKSVLEKK